MNQRNVEALHRVIVAYVQQHGYIDLVDPDAAESGGIELAQFFASRGVLVPSVIAPEDAASDAFLDATIDLHSMDGEPEFPDRLKVLIQLLERIAKGETA